MAKLKLGPLLDDKPVKFPIEHPAVTHRDLQAYAAASPPRPSSPRG